ncbi:MAG: hypothetical protein H6623_08435 [Bdellovibrionaceae bacterium]|nr:hypothetical protein [Pseudobdellovibrionaceae bacterium]
MKTLTTLLFTLTLSCFALAQTTQALPTTLKGTMKAMSANLKTISVQVKTPPIKPTSADLADQFVELTLHSKTFTPKSISSLPKNQQADATSLYNQMLDHTADLGAQLAVALRANDAAKAADLLKQLLQAKTDGHNQF